MKVAVLGAGISGLSAAWRLKNLGVEAIVFEGAARAGGAISSFADEGFIAENGPHTFLNSQQIFDDMIVDLGLETHRVWANEVAKKRYAVKDGIPVALPMSPRDLVESPLYSTASKFKLLLESRVPPRGDEIDESVTSFVKRRLGEDFLNYGVDLLVNGIWAGDPNRLSVRHAFKKLYGLEASGGSLTRGGIRAARDKTRRKGAGKIFSFRGGNLQLVDALVGAVDVRLNCPVKSIERRGNTWRVVAGKGRGKAHEFDAVISTVDALSLAQILDDAYALKIKERLYYPPVAVVTFGFERAQVAHPLDGFGMLIPEVEGRDILGTMFSSTLFENRAPADHVTIAVFVGGARHPQNALMPSADRRALVLRELKSLLGVSGQPVFEHENVWKRAIPQYEVGHSDVQVWAQAIERKHPGLVVGGNFVNAVAVPDLVAAAVGQADAITRGSV